MDSILLSLFELSGSTVFSNQIKSEISMSDIQTCSVGLFKKSDRFQTTYTPSKKLQPVSELSEEEKDLIHLRSGINLCEFKNIRSHHSYYFLNVFEKYQTTCVDPLKKNTKSSSKNC